MIYVCAREGKFTARILTLANVKLSAFAPIFLYNRRSSSINLRRTFNRVASSPSPRVKIIPPFHRICAFFHELSGQGSSTMHENVKNELLRDAARKTVGAASSWFGAQFVPRYARTRGFVQSHCERRWIHIYLTCNIFIWSHYLSCLSHSSEQRTKPLFSTA